MQHILDTVKDHQTINKLFKYYSDKKYLYLFVKQIENINKNVKSIDVLINIDNIGDAYSIYRKLLETFFILSSVYEHPDLSTKFVEHNYMLQEKLLGNNKKEINLLIKNNVDNFIEYGYLLPYLDKNIKKITMYDIANIGNTLNFFHQYKICNNFVHNNLNLLKFNEEDAKKELIVALNNVIDYLDKKISQI